MPSRSAVCPARARASTSSARSRRRTRTTSPRASASATTSRAAASFVLRGGYGRYYDFAYTNANILFAVIGAQSSFGDDLLEQRHERASRTRTARSSRSGQPLPPNELANAAAPLPSHAASPRIKQPYQDQANLGFAWALGKGFAVELEGVYAKGGDLGTRPNINLRIDGGPPPPGGRPAARPATPNFRIDTSAGVSHYKGATVSIKKRWDGNLQLLGWYTLSSASSIDQPARDRRVRRVQRPRHVRPLQGRAGGADPQRLAAPLHGQRHLEPGRRVLHLAGLPLQVEGSLQRDHGRRRQPRRHDDQRPAGWRHQLQLGARRGVQAVRPAGLQEVQPGQPRPHGSDRRDLQPVQRREPRRLRRQR